MYRMNGFVRITFVKTQVNTLILLSLANKFLTFVVHVLLQKVSKNFIVNCQTDTKNSEKDTGRGKTRISILLNWKLGEK